MIWLIGSNGMLGTEIARELKENSVDFIGTDIDVDITNIDALRSFAKGKVIDWIINCAAYTAVDKAESDEVLADKLNNTAPGNIAKVAKESGAKLIHISTDYVFDGTGNTPRTEEMPVAPLGVYGVTKAKGEKSVISNTDEYYILRTAWLYSWHGKNFVYTMIRAMNTHDAVKVVSDQRGTPTFGPTLANIILKIINQNSTLENKNSHDEIPSKPSVPYGIYHCTDEGETTWFEFTKEIKRQAVELGLVTNKDCTVNPCTTEEYPTPAKRPAYSVLSKAKIQNALNIRLPQWQDSLSEFLKSGLFEKDRIM
ncbi:MAG: dTDP-4-dehydrorhamnose reductase [Treponema sp.]|nr:dTDP-4-dehydrorhamnose reductase [Candidatus Treponema merdequi]